MAYEKLNRMKSRNKMLGNKRSLKHPVTKNIAGIRRWTFPKGRAGLVGEGKKRVCAVPHAVLFH